MIKREKVLTLLIAAIIALLHITQSSASRGMFDIKNNDEKGKNAQQFTHNFSPETPKSVTFAGEKIDLTLQDRRERMDREMLSFCYSHINTMLQIKRANRLFPIVEPILKKHGIPDDFKYLMII